MKYFHRCCSDVLGQKVVISVLLLLALICYSASEAYSQKQDTAGIKMQYSLDEVKITASGLMSVNSKMDRILTVFEADDLENSPAGSLQDILDYHISVDLRNRGPEGVQGDITLRGGTFDQTLILLNGVNITDPQTGHHNLNIPVNLSQIERVEFLNGNSVREYGQAAFSGAVNIVTKEPAGNSAGVSLSKGGFDFSEVTLSGNIKTGELCHALGTDFKKSEGYIDNTDFKISSLYYSNIYKSGKGSIVSQGGITHKAFGANSFYTPKYPDQFEEIFSSLFSVKWISSGRMHFTPLVYFRINTDKFLLFRDMAPDWYQGHNYHRTGIWGGKFNSWHLWRWGKTAYGAEYRSEKIISSVLGEEMKKRIKVPREDAFYLYWKNRATSSFFFEHSFYLYNLTFSAGGIVNHISDNDGLNFFPGVDLNYQISPATRAELTWNRSMRMPTFTDLYYSGPSNIGNSSLNPEKSDLFEGSVKVNNAFIKSNIAVFYRIGYDMIDWIKREEDDLWQSQNHTEIRSLGGEIQFRFNTGMLFNGKGPENLYLGYYFNNQIKEHGELVSYYLLDYLRHKFVASVNFSITDNIFFNLINYYQDRAGTFTQYININDSVEKPYTPFWLFDAELLMQFKKLKISLSAINLFDNSYMDLGNIIQPGRWLKAGVSYNINFNY